VCPAARSPLGDGYWRHDGKSASLIYLFPEGSMALPVAAWVLAAEVSTVLRLTLDFRRRRQDA
jgi:hypothetical protein